MDPSALESLKTNIETIFQHATIGIQKDIKQLMNKYQDDIQSLKKQHHNEIMTLHQQIASL